ncbi:MAG TPA: transposase [Chthoniobacterales bacterium]|nr:transposase [Chthoniobacterales bacterium]
MARPTRLHVEGGWYLVVNRGIERRAIFRGSAGYEHFIELLGELPQRFGVKVHAFVLLPNHYHLQLETPHANLSRAVQWLNVSYSIWFNKKYERVGPLFQGRFKAILHDLSSHGLTINKYIHHNPVRVRSSGGHEKRSSAEVPSAADLAAARVETLRTYPWSSYQYYSATQKAPGWLTTDTILGLLDPRASVVRYRRELEEAASAGEPGTDWKTELKASLLLGSKEFVEQMGGLLKGDQGEQTAVRQVGLGRLTWQEITDAVSRQWGQDWETLRKGHGNGALPAALYLGRQYTDRTLRELGELAGGMQYPAVTMAIRRFAKQLETNKVLASKIKHLKSMLPVKTSP